MRRYLAQVDPAGATSFSWGATILPGACLLLLVFVKQLIFSKCQSVFQKTFYIFQIYIQGEREEMECMEPFMNYLHVNQYVTDNDNNNALGAFTLFSIALGT